MIGAAMAKAGSHVLIGSGLRRIGVFIVYSPLIGLALAFTVLRGLAAALVGSFRSFWWTLAGAFGIGVVESTLSRYIENKGVFGPLVADDGLLLGKFTSASVYRSFAFLLIVVVFIGRRWLVRRGQKPIPWLWVLPLLVGGLLCGYLWPLLRP